MPTATVSTTREVQLKSTIKTKLLKELKAYAELRAQKKVLDEAMKKHSNSVQDILGDLEESSIAVDGFKATLVTNVRKTLSREKLIAQGVTEDQLRRATIESLGKEYLKITVPGAKNDDDE